MSKKKAPKVGLASLLGPMRELKAAKKHDRPIVVLGAPSLASALRRELIARGDAGAIRETAGDDDAALVYVLAGAPGEPELKELRRASLAGVPIIAVADREGPIPYVLATDVVTIPRGEGFPVPEIARALARRLGDDAAPLAARLPVLREAVAARLVKSAARKNAFVGAAVFIPGADMPVMTLRQMRLVARLAAVHDMEAEPKRALELLGVVGSGLGFRYAGRSLLGLVPVAGWAVRAGMGYAGTVAVGEAAVRYYASLDPDD